MGSQSNTQHIMPKPLKKTKQEVIDLIDTVSVKLSCAESFMGSGDTDLAEQYLKEIHELTYSVH